MREKEKESQKQREQRDGYEKDKKSELPDGWVKGYREEFIRREEQLLNIKTTT